MLAYLALSDHAAAESSGQHSHNEKATETNLHNRILLVEDDPAIRSLVGRILRRQGYEVSEAVNGRNALEMVANAADTFRLVLTDMMMPEMDGVALVEHLRALNMQCAVIYMTGYYDLPVPHEQGSLLLHKPFKIQTLLDAIQQALTTDRR